MTSAESRDDEKRAEIVRAAIDCFIHYGLSRTTMDDVAAAAGLSRRSIYNYIGNKTDLIGAVFADELQRACTEATARLDLTLPAAELIALAEVSLFEVAVDRPLIKRFLDAESVTLTMEVTGRDKRLREILIAYWAPILDRLDSSGQLRTDVPRPRLVEWLLWIHQMLLAHPATMTNDLDQTEEMLQQFLAPALLRPGTPLMT